MVKHAGYLERELNTIPLLPFLDQTFDGLWYWDITNDQKWYTDKFWSKFGYRSGETTTAKIILPEDQQVLKSLRDSIKTGLLYDQVVRYRHKNGHVIYVHSKGVLLCPNRFLGVHINITYQKRLEEQLQDKINKLEQATQTIKQQAADMAVLQSAITSLKAYANQ